MPITVRLPLAIVFSSFEPGGTERQMAELVRRLDPARWDLHVACLRSGAWFDRVREAATVTEFPVRSFKRPDVIGHVASFARWCRRNNIAVVHTTDLPSNLFGLPGAALARVPVRIANRREVNPGRSAGELGAQRAAYACAHRIVANCRAAANQLETERVPGRKISIVPNGIEIDSHAAAPSRRGAPRRVVTVANLRPGKGHDVLIDAAAIVRRRFPEAVFVFVGDGPELPSLRERASGVGLLSAVKFIGHSEDVPAELAAADIFVLPSRSEAFPNAVLEAMASGIPVVASAVGGILEMVEHGRTGLLVPPGDPSALAIAIGRLMAEPDLAFSMGTAASVEAARYSFRRMVSSFEEIYFTELGRRGFVAAGRRDFVTS